MVQENLELSFMNVDLTYPGDELVAFMKSQGLVSSYTVAQYKPHKAACNKSQQSNELNRQFYQSEAKRVVVSDLTYVRVKSESVK